MKPKADTDLEFASRRLGLLGSLCAGLGLMACFLPLLLSKPSADKHRLHLADVFLLFPLLVGLGVSIIGGTLLFENFQRKRFGRSLFLWPARGGLNTSESYGFCLISGITCLLIGLAAVALSAVLAFFRFRAAA